MGQSHLRRRVVITTALIVPLSLAALGRHFWTPRGMPDPDRLWFDAESAFLSGRWDRARNGLERLSRIRPKTGLDWMLEAQLDISQGKFDQAHATISQVSDHHPIAPQA